MLAYYISASNSYAIRTQQTGSSDFTLHLQNMYTLTDSSSSISQWTYDAYESLFEFTASIVSASIGDEYRARISDGSKDIWHGSIQVYTSQSIDKPDYKNQIPLEQVYISNVTENEYIILS